MKLAKKLCPKLDVIWKIFIFEHKKDRPMLKFFLSISITIALFLSFSSCKRNRLSIDNEKKDSINNSPESTVQARISNLKPEEMMFLVEGAVDSWMFYNLDNFASYEVIMRKTDYDSVRNIHIHHVRYRTMNKEGGYETTEKTFDVTFSIDKKGVLDYTINEIPTLEPYFRNREIN